MRMQAAAYTVLIVAYEYFLDGCKSLLESVAIPSPGCSYARYFNQQHTAPLWPV